MNQQKIDIMEFPPDVRTKIKALVSQGAIILLVNQGTEIGRIIPAGKRTPNLYPDGAWVACDFNDPLPDQFWADADQKDS